MGYVEKPWEVPRFRPKRRTQSDGTFSDLRFLFVGVSLSWGAAEKPRLDGKPEERNICQLEVTKSRSRNTCAG